MKNATRTSGQETVPIGNVGVGQQWGEGISRVVLWLPPLQTPFDKALTCASDSKILSWAQIHFSRGFKIHTKTFNSSYSGLSRELASAWSKSLYAPNTLRSIQNSLSRISSYTLLPALANPPNFSLLFFFHPACQAQGFFFRIVYFFSGKS